jgi:hypothetical protein
MLRLAPLQELRKYPPPPRMSQAETVLHPTAAAIVRRLEEDRLLPLAIRRHAERLLVVLLRVSRAGNPG